MNTPTGAKSDYKLGDLVLIKAADGRPWPATITICEWNIPRFRGKWRIQEVLYRRSKTSGVKFSPTSHPVKLFCCCFLISNCVQWIEADDFDHFAPELISSITLDANSPKYKAHQAAFKEAMTIYKDMKKKSGAIFRRAAHRAAAASRLGLNHDVGNTSVSAPYRTRKPAHHSARAAGRAGTKMPKVLASDDKEAGNAASIGESTLNPSLVCGTDSNPRGADNARSAPQDTTAGKTEHAHAEPDPSFSQAALDKEIQKAMLEGEKRAKAAIFAAFMPHGTGANENIGQEPCLVGKEQERADEGIDYGGEVSSTDEYNVEQGIRAAKRSVEDNASNELERPHDHGNGEEERAVAADQGALAEPRTQENGEQQEEGHEADNDNGEEEEEETAESNEVDREFQLGDLVFAKYKNHPHWPALIERCTWRRSYWEWKKHNPVKFFVRFLEEDTCEWVLAEDMELFKPDEIKNFQCAVTHVMYNEQKQAIESGKAYYQQQNLKRKKTERGDWENVDVTVAVLEANEKLDFKVGDLVMAQVTGHPFWPGTIAQCWWRKEEYHLKCKIEEPTRFWCHFPLDDSANWVEVERVLPFDPESALQFVDEEDKDLVTAIEAMTKLYNKRNADEVADEKLQEEEQEGGTRRSRRIRRSMKAERNERRMSSRKKRRASYIEE